MAARLTQDEIAALAREEDLAIQASWTRIAQNRRTPMAVATQDVRRYTEAGKRGRP